MPYVCQVDREAIDPYVESVAQEAATLTLNSRSLIDAYKNVFSNIAACLTSLVYEQSIAPHRLGRKSTQLASVIFSVARQHEYESAFLGNLNYAVTRFIQRVPQIKVERGDWKESEEFRYWLYASIVEALIYTANTCEMGTGISGVFEDIKDEYKRRVNTAYEAEQIIKNGDCYDTPWRTILVEVVDENGIKVGRQEIMIPRSEETLGKDVLDGVFVLKRKIAQKL